MDLNQILIYIFWIFFGLLFLTYVYYPLMLKWIKWGKKIPSPTYLSEKPRVSVLFSVYNEEDVIESKLENLFSQTYPSDKLEIIVVSDASFDKTDTLLQNEKFTDRIIFHRLEKRSGKAKALNKAFELSSGDILVFTDSNTMFEPDAIEKLVRNFGTFGVGGVCGHLKITSSGNHKLESRYWRMERWMKKMEGTLGSVIGANGGIYAIKREYFKPLPTNRNILDDFITSLQPLRFNKRLIFEPEAIAIEESCSDPKSEYERHKRIANADFNSIKEVRFLFNLFRFGWTTIFFILHKILRWFAPLFLLGMYFTNLFINFQYRFYVYASIFQIVFYLLGFVGWLFLRKGKQLPILNYIAYFCMMNVALLTGFLNWIGKDSPPFWEPSRK